MKEDAVYTEKYHDLDIKIFRDEDYTSPEDDRDDGLFLVGYHRDFYVDHSFRVDGRAQGGISKELAVEIAEDKEYDGCESALAAEYRKKYHIFGLEAYIHSGVSLALSREGNFPDRQWDVSQLGLVFVAKKEWRTRPAARKAALGLISSWNDNLSGNVYGYVIEPGGDSCWGFYGDYDKGALPEARSQAAFLYKEAIKKRAARTKAMIKNKVELIYRGV